jgi:DNA-binding transcriptional LysR family regulator
VLSVAEHHRCADADSLDLADLINEPIPRLEAMGRGWWDHWSFADVRGERPRTVRVGTVSDSLLAIANGQAVGWCPQSLSRFSPYAGLRYIPMTATPRVAAVVARRRTDRRPPVRSFVTMATQTASPLHGLVPGASRVLT